MIDFPVVPISILLTMDTLKGKNIIKFPKKSIVFKESDFSRDLYIIKSGKVRLFKKVGNKNLPLSDLETGSILGELSVIDNGARSATAVAMEDTEAIIITPADFAEVSKTVPEWFQGIARVLAQRLRATDKKLTLTGPNVNEANITAILVYLFKGVKDSLTGLLETEIENLILTLLNISVADLQDILEKLEKISLIIRKGKSIGTDSVSLLENHLTKIRQNLSETFII